MIEQCNNSFRARIDPEVFIVVLPVGNRVLRAAYVLNFH